MYGYQKSKEDKHKLVIEPEEAAVVRVFFAEAKWFFRKF